MLKRRDTSFIDDSLATPFLAAIMCLLGEVDRLWFLAVAYLVGTESILLNLSMVILRPSFLIGLGLFILVPFIAANSC